ncbi:unnamed protein product [Zymoseptoria tritici ST99CH_1A5]|uniref:Rhodopsin domain-containing protein n=3 Tax=Zymoseptoria tritici TaxID=1047171 RepID=A0A1X7S4F9_ZYMT9|nr:unnamed protein product [Zymoseptoria tritici ST99CH_3D7]SMR59024.1 unnamed protein product [Zymoseptoria tritici ST99CH_1E4]SMY28235.1 unnamed protein product [Zymoseptoria tritici ST99CH_1A5]
MAPSNPTYTFSPVTSTDRAGIVWVAGILSFMFTLLVLITRFQIKGHTLGLDDWLIAGATIVATGQYIAVYIGLNEGLGTSSTLLSQDHAGRLAHAVLASEVMFILALMLSKFSVLFFMKRLFTKEHRAAWLCCNLGFVLTAIWGVACAIGISVGCGSYMMLYGPARCDGKLARWSVTIALDGALEVAYVGLAVLLVYPLQMKRTIKATVVFAFSFRLTCAVLAALHGYWISLYVHSSDPGLAIADVLVWQQVALGYALIATTIPTLKNFIRGYNHALGGDGSSTGKRGLGGGYNLGSHVRSRDQTNTNSGNLSKLQRSSKQNSKQNSGLGSASKVRQEQEEGFQMGPVSGAYRVGAFHDSGPPRERPSDVGSDDPIIIRRDMSVTVETERASSSWTPN